VFPIVFNIMIDMLIFDRLERISASGTRLLRVNISAYRVATQGTIFLCHVLTPRLVEILHIGVSGDPPTVHFHFLAVLQGKLMTHLSPGYGHDLRDDVD